MFLFLNMEASTVHSRHPETKKIKVHFLQRTFLDVKPFMG